MSAQKIFTRTIWALGFVSLFNDISSEMLYPVMPIYLKSIGFTALWIGILEGVAEAVVGLSKGYFGKLSDEKGKRLPFVQLGYFLSAISKPIFALFTNPAWIFSARSTDKFGKGIRTSARDAMLSDECSKENKGKVFGFHRAMDTIGAAIGPLFALVYLYFHPYDYKTLFFIAFAPSMVSVLFTLLIKEKKKEVPESLIVGAKGNFFSYFSYWKRSSTEYRSIVIGLLLFALFNSSDVFLLLMAKSVGISDEKIILVYVFYNLVYAVFSLPFGHLADKIGMKKTFAFGLVLFCITYLGIGFLHSVTMLASLFFVYGMFAAASEGVSKAWVAKISPQNETATAIGFFSSASSMATMVSSSLAGLIWVTFNPQTTFLFSSAGALMILIYFLFKTK